MKRRKRIGLFVSFPEAVHVHRITDGVRQQCEKYNYDLCVFASPVNVAFPYSEYLQGETNIFELADFNELDGVILDYETLTGDKDDAVKNRLIERLKEFPNLPVCSLQMPIGDFKVMKSDDEATLREMVRHAANVHGKKKFCIVTGPKDNVIAEERLDIFLDELKKNKITVDEDQIEYGDFWYTGGERLAERIIHHKMKISPDAVLCANDCMALGLIERLRKYNIRVPEDIIVIGFDATDEGAINRTSLSSYAPADKVMGIDAVDYIRSLMEPRKKIEPRSRKISGEFHPGSSCGCQSEPVYAMDRFRNLLYKSSSNYDDADYMKKISIGTLMESYVLESFTGADSANQCMENIFNNTNLLYPYRNFYLCLKDNWLDMDDNQRDGFPEEMSIWVATSMAGEEEFFGDQNVMTFKTKDMLPKLSEKRDEPSVFYFSPVHFNGTMLGYTVLQRDIQEQAMLNIVYRNWLRFINNALEMIRSRQRLQTLSVRDEMTGAYNRRGMYITYKKLLASAGKNDSLFIAVIDMDGLKYINDTFGHNEGDFGIKTVCGVAMSVLRKNEICVRSGGDEFFIVGIGKYAKKDVAQRATEFCERINAKSDECDKPYRISASIGCVVVPDVKNVVLDSAISEADERMYRYKVINRRHRTV